MTTSNTRFGLSVALATAFEPSGEIADTQLLAHARTCLDGGCDSVTLFGTTGEGPSLGWEERVRLLTQFKAAGITGDQLVCGISATAVKDAVAQIRAAQVVGCRRILLPPPYYFKQPSDEGVEAWYREVLSQLDQGSVSVILYNIPALTQVALSVGLIGRLRETLGDAVIGVKDSSGDWSYTEALLNAHKDISILVGEERHLAAAVRLGGAGAICGMANLDPAAVRRMACDGKEEPYINDLIDLLEKFPLIPAIKSAIAHQSGDPVWFNLRAPLVGIGQDDGKRLEQALDQLKIARAG
ncbi:dihydrodipicolinate synthase family protein [Denitrobaculum tricleocarpae]|uniref:Dihydrodipicolinate synthase family protein n=1 Tax=Denitrobaculum tricleocarpae TaxID=2591009 RepID=A0A545U1N0_9PROT|nr:dihydrodipicolinate synthase family protein [Denitrobaculum tricleocarpae]TQV83344.1 dihydrodipicolinate synthase family protein [Denitrobaculum tricleocarpae]